MYNLINETNNKNIFKEINRIRVLKYIWDNTPVSRVEISKRIGLSRSTLTLITKELICNNILKEIGQGNSTKEGGKKPTLLDFNKNYGYIIGVTIGLSKIKLAYSNIRAEIIKESEEKRELNESPNKSLEKVINLIKKLNISNYKKLLGLGIGIPGVIDHINGVVKFSPNLPGWKSIPIKECLENELGEIKVFIDRETNLQVFAEKWFGGIKSKNFIAVEAGIGIGIGILINDRIYRGSNNAAGEFGHTTILPNGSECHCGNYGCWETLSTTRNVVNKAINGIKKGVRTNIKDYEINGKITFDSVINGYKNGDDFAKELLKDYAYWLGIGIANIINTFDPELIIIYGNAIQLGSLGLKTINKVVREKALPKLKRDINIKYSDFGKEAKLIGALGIVIKNALSIPEEHVF